MIRLKVSWEMVSAIGHPEYYRGEHPCVAAAQVPDEHWHRVEREGDDGIRVQYNGLRRLIDQGELIRNVQLFVATAPQWREIPEATR